MTLSVLSVILMMQTDVIVSSTHFSETNQEWSTYMDWIGKGFRQILVENHGVPTPSGNQANKQWFQKPLDVSEYYGEFKKHGYALFNRDFHGRAVDLSFIKLDKEFWEQ